MDKIALKLNGDFIVCEELEYANQDRYDGICIFSSEEIKQYRIVKLHLKEDTDFPFEIGDIVVSGSTGTTVIERGVVKKLFRPEHIIAKILRSSGE